MRRDPIKGQDRNSAVEAAYDPKGHGTKVQYTGSTARLNLNSS